MQRDLPGLADTTFDLVVVGAGIYGALAAWEAARRGWRVALVDTGDVGHATSFNSLKTLHGGLRSLQALNLRQMRLFIRERRALAIMAPHLVDPLPFCVPTYAHPTRSRLALATALAITDAVGRDRHEGIDDVHLRLPGGRVVSRAECVRLNPIVADDGITGGAIWFDYQMRQPERLITGVVASAAAAGAVIGTYVEADRMVRSGDRVVALRVRDVTTGTTFDVRTATVLNATGPWSAAVATQLTGAPATDASQRLSRAMNLVVSRITGDHACGGVVAGRYLFAVPWHDVSIVGTSHDPHEGGADAPHGTPEHVAALLRDAQLAFPKAGLGAAAVRLVHRGLLPMVSSSGTSVALLKESAVVDHASHGARGLVTIHSVRYTTARHTATAAVDVVGRLLGRESAAPRPALRLSSAGFETVEALLADARHREMPATTPALRERLARAYGTGWIDVASAMASTPDLAIPLSPTCAVTRAEVRHAVVAEGALTLTDALLRRTAAGGTGHPGVEARDAAAAVMRDLLGWDAARVERECAALDRQYPGLATP